jgi:hypothetical protein
MIQKSIARSGQHITEKVDKIFDFAWVYSGEVGM